MENLLFDGKEIHIEGVFKADGMIVVNAMTITDEAACPKCRHPSSRVHSRYRRSLADLPWFGQPVKLLVRVRRFYCLDQECPRRIFTEQVPTVTVPYARRTLRQQEALGIIGLALGGEAGQRTAARLGFEVSADTLLRRVRQTASRTMPTPRILGVDDFAFRRGHSYGTILVDLERRRPIELLPNRESATLAAWLKSHPGVEIITRDRSRAYAEAIVEGSPEAVQVADRWHILKNLYEALERLLTRQHHLIRQAVQPDSPPPQPMPESKPASISLISKQSSSPRSLLQPKRAGVAEHRLRRLALYTEAIRLLGEGLSIEEIAKQIGKSRRTVQRWLNEGAFRHDVRHRRSTLDRYLPFLTSRWHEGCHNILQLWRELAEQGYGGSYKSLNNYLHRNFSPPPALPSLPSPPVQLVNNGRIVRRIHRTGSPPLIPPPSPRQALWMLLKPEKLKEPEQKVVERLVELSPEIKKAVELAGRFHQLMKERKVRRLRDWMEEAKNSKVPELRGFVRGIESDQPLIEAAISQEWSNGQTEGQVHRLKLLKRQMYGRAKLDLLQARVLNAA